MLRTVKDNREQREFSRDHGRSGDQAGRTIAKSHMGAHLMASTASQQTPVAPGLVSAAKAIDATRTAADEGRLTLSKDAAENLILAIEEVLATTRSEIEPMLRGVLIQPLQFGNNWVGELIKARLANTAGDAPESMGPVIKQFERVLRQMADTAREAARRYQQVEDDIAAQLRALEGPGAQA